MKEDGKSLEKMTRYKSFIIGCGKIAGLYDDLDDDSIYSHAKAYINNNKVDIVGCWDLNIKNSKTLAEKYNLDVYECNYVNALEKTKPDIVSICTPDNTHFEITMSILESDFNPQIIFLEKPACGNENELKILLNASNKKGVKVVINHSRRFDKLHKALKEKIQENSFGSLVKIDAVYYSGWQHNGIHTVDTLNFLFDDELEFETLINSSDSPYENDPNLDFKCRFKGNQALVYLTTMNERYYQLFEFDLKFENARIRIEDFGNRLSYEKKTVNNMYEKVLVESDLFISDDSRSSAIQSAVKELVDNLDGGTSLDGYLLKDIAKTMNTIWEGKKWTE